MISNNKKQSGFPSTLWTDIVRWDTASDEEKRLLLERFYTRYKRPLLNFIYAFGLDRSESQDALHDFMLSHMQGKLFVAADPAKGRFRSLLLRSLKHFLISSMRTKHAGKRRPERGFVLLDDEVLSGVKLKDLIADDDSVEAIYDRIWLATVLSNVLDRLQSEYQEKGQEIHYRLLERRVILPIVAGDKKPSYDELAKDYDISAEQASNFVVTAKRAYQRLLKAEIREYVSSEKEVTEEINDFLYFLQNLRR